MNKKKAFPSSVKDMGSSLLSEGKTIRIKAHGYSMYPSIKPGSILIIEPLRQKGMAVPGEIIAIKREKGMIVHRLIRILLKDDAKTFIARGDSNPYADNPLPISRIVGRVIRAETSGENPSPADIKVNPKPRYLYFRFLVINLLLFRKFKNLWYTIRNLIKRR